MAELYEANSTVVYRVCQRILKDTDDAADAAQQVFLIALDSLDLTLSRSAARAWLLTVARNHCIDLLRRRKRLGKALVTLGNDAGRVVDMEASIADRDFVGIVFKQLTRRERQALWHSAVESRPLADIAGRLRLSYMAAAQVLHRARRHAVQVVARVAVVFGIFQLGRQRVGGGLALAATRLAAVAAMPVILVSIQSSSPTPQTASTVSPAVSTVASAPAKGGSTAALSARQLPPPLRGRVGVEGVTPGSTATLNSAIGAVQQLLGPVSAVPPLPVPTPVPRLP